MALLWRFSNNLLYFCQLKLCCKNLIQKSDTEKRDFDIITEVTLEETIGYLIILQHYFICFLFSDTNVIFFLAFNE